MRRLSAALALAALLLPAWLRAADPPSGAGREPDVRARVAATGRLTERAPLLEALASDPEPLVRAVAAETLGRRREAGAASALAAALLGDADPGVREEAVRALAALARRVDPRLFARAALEYLPEDAHIERDRTLPPDAVSALAKATADPSPAVRGAAVRALGEVGPPPATAWPSLAARLERDGEAAVRALAAQALGRLGEPRAGDPLARALDDPAAAVRAAAARAIGRLAGAGAEPASRLRARLHRAAGGDRDPAVRAAALEALVAWTPPSDSPSLVARLAAALDDPAEGVRAAAADGLTLGAPHPAALASRLDLDRRLARETAPAARAALHALAARLRPSAPGAHLDALVAALDDRAARRAAERGLVRLGRAGLPAAAALRARLAAGAGAGGPEAAGPDSPVARALARVEAGGPLVLPEPKP